MSLPHQCRCAICGEIGTITPGLPNVFAKSKPVFVAQEVVVDYEGEERRLKPIVPTETSPYASSRADELAPRGEPPYVEVATCIHGYTRCMICKYPAA